MLYKKCGDKNRQSSDNPASSATGFTILHFYCASLLPNEAPEIRIYFAILAKLLKRQRFDSINYLPSVRE